MEIRSTVPWYKSKRVWWNFITIALGIGQHLSDGGGIPAGTMEIINPLGNLLLNQLTDGAKITATQRP